MARTACLILLLAAAFLSPTSQLRSDVFPGTTQSLLPNERPRSTTEGKVPSIMLRASGGPLETGGPTSALFSSVGDDLTVYAVNGLTGEVQALKSEGVAPRHLGKTSGPMAVRSQRSFAYIDKEEMVVLAEPNGKFIRRLEMPAAISVDFLSNGNIVVASPVRDSFLHMFTPSGSLLRNFGAIKKHRGFDRDQNRFLHKGKVVCDASDNIYYVYYYLPLIQKFTRLGQLEREIEVSGAAINLQQELAERYFENKPPDEVGGISIINGAGIDARTGHLWIGMNGSSNAATIYEYDGNGNKVREYTLHVDARLITGIRDLAITRSRLYVVTNEYQLYQFEKAGSSERNSTSQTKQAPLKNGYQVKTVSWSRGAPTLLAGGQSCGTPQNWDPCGFTCPDPVCQGSTPTATSSTGAQLDCKGQLQATLSMSYVVINSNCTTYPAGTQNHMRGGCTSFVRICKNGLNSDHTMTIDCPVPTCNQGGGGGECEGDPGVCDSGCSWSFCEQCCLCGGTCNSPVVIDVLGNGFNLTDGNHGVFFDINKDTVKERLAWTSENSDDAFLALDRNGNGTIDDGGELFGNYTPQALSAGGNGFLALAEFDIPANGGNLDGIIDRRDAIFSSLWLWQDKNHDGISQTGELNTLSSLGLASIDLDYKDAKRRDQHGNFFRYRSKFTDTRGAQIGWAWDVFLTAPR